MPNTLAHIAVQTLATKQFVRNENYLAWGLLGCVIPDLPWIMQRLLLFSPVAVDPYTLRAYATVQAALFMAMVFTAACALLFERFVHAFTTVTAGCILHLCLDASEIKWANGVHFFAPFDWQQANWGFVWPEHAVVATASLVGIPLFGYMAWKSASLPIRLKIDRWRMLGTALLILVYVSAPIAFLEGPFQGNSHYIQTLIDIETRAGKYIELDRPAVGRSNGIWYARTYAGESIELDSFNPGESGTFSLRGYFASSRSITVTDWYRHDGTRDSASIIGLILVLSWFSLAVYRQFGRPG